MQFQVFPQDGDISPPKRVKFGIDPTIDRLHLGHFIPLRLIRKLQKQGHQVTIVLGTFTAQLGDPSGRDSTRPILDEATTKRNAQAIMEQVKKLLPQGFIFCCNDNIHNNMRLPEFMGLVSKFTLAHLTSRNSFQQRIQNQQPIGMHELLVPLLQGWDSVALHTEIEVGGQDQLFNFQIARQLQELQGQPPQTCLMLPIINGTDGRKMSKSLGNCIFLDEPPRDIFGKVMSIPDTVMDEWFPLLTDREPLTHPMQSKKRLAYDIVQQLHDQPTADDCLLFFESTVQHKGLPDNIPP